MNSVATLSAISQTSPDLLDDAALLPVVHKKIQESTDLIDEMKKNMEPLVEQNKQAFEKLCMLLNTLTQNVQSAVETRREQLEESKTATAAQSRDAYDLRNSQFALETKNIQPIMSQPFRSMPYAHQDGASATTKALNLLDLNLTEANRVLQEFTKDATKKQQLITQIYKSFVLNYSTRMITPDYALKSTPELIPFAVPGYALAGIKLVLELSKINTPSRFETKRKEFVESLEKTNTSNTLDADWLAFLKDIAPAKARGNVSRYLTLVSRTCSESVFQYYATMYRRVLEISEWMEGDNLLTSWPQFGTLSTSIESKLTELFPGNEITSIVASAAIGTPTSLLSSTEIRCVEPKLGDSLSLKEYLQRETTDFCEEGEGSGESGEGSLGNMFICRGVNLLTDDPDHMLNTIEFMTAQGFDHETIVERVVDDATRTFKSCAGAKAFDESKTFDEAGAKSALPMAGIRAAFSQAELNKLISPLGYTLVNTRRIFQFHNFNFHNMFVDLSEYFAGEHATINDFFGNITHFYSGDALNGGGDISLWQLLHNCFDGKLVGKLQQLATAEFPDWSKALFIDKVCFDEAMTDVPLDSVIFENRNLLFPLKLSFRDATVIAQYYARIKKYPELAKPDISLYCPLDNIMLQPHVFITVLYIVGLYRAWLDSNITKMSTQVGRLATSKNNILTHVQAFLTPTNANSSQLLTAMLILKASDFLFRTMTIANQSMRVASDETESTGKVLPSQTEMPHAEFLRRMQTFGHATIEQPEDLSEALPHLLRAADTYHAKVGVNTCLDASRSNLFIASYQTHQWAQICLDQMTFGAFLKRQPAGESIIALNRNIAIALYVQNKKLYEAMQNVPELNELDPIAAATAKDRENEMMADLETVLDLDNLAAGNEDEDDPAAATTCSFDAIYLRRGVRHTYLNKFLHDCLTKEILGGRLGSLTNWYYYYISPSASDLGGLLPNGDKMQLISYANIFTKPYYESFFEHSATTGLDGVIVGESRQDRPQQQQQQQQQQQLRSSIQRVFMTPYAMPEAVLQNKTLTPVGSFEEVARKIENLDKSLELYVPIRRSGFSNFKAIRHGDELIVMNASTPYMVVQRLLESFNKIFGGEDAWTVTVSPALLPGFTRIALLPSNMISEEKEAGSRLFYHISRRSSTEDRSTPILRLLEFCAPLDEIVIECSVVADLAQAAAGGSETLPLFDNIDYEVGGVSFDVGSGGKRKLSAAPAGRSVRRRLNNGSSNSGGFSSLSGTDLILSRDFENQMEKTRAAQADRFLKKLSKWDRAYQKYMGQISSTCNKLQDDPPMPDLKGFFVEFQPDGIREIFKRFDAKAAMRAAKSNSLLGLSPMDNTFNSLSYALNSLDRLKKGKSLDGSVSLVSLHKNLAQFNLLLNLGANAHRAFVRTTFDAIRQIEKYILFAMCAPLVQLHFYRNINKYLFNEIPSKYAYLERFLSRDSAYLQVNVHNLADYFAENVDFFERDPALHLYYVFYQNLAKDQKSFLFVLTPAHVLRTSNSMFYLGLLAIFLAHSIENWRQQQQQAAATAAASVPLTASAINLPVPQILQQQPTTQQPIQQLTPPQTTPQQPIQQQPIQQQPIQQQPIQQQAQPFVPFASQVAQPAAQQTLLTQPLAPQQPKYSEDMANTHIWIPAKSGWESMDPVARVNYIHDNYAAAVQTPGSLDPNTRYIVIDRPVAELIADQVILPQDQLYPAMTNDLRNYASSLAVDTVPAPPGELIRRVESQKQLQGQASQSPDQAVSDQHVPTF